MYGKKRVVINKRNQIIIAGKTEGSKGGSWIPIGIVIKNSRGVIAKFLHPTNMFERKLSDENSISLSVETIKEVRTVINNLYNIPK